MPGGGRGALNLERKECDAAGWPMLRLRLPSGEELLLEKCRDCE